MPGRDVDVAEEFDRPRRGGVECCRFAKVAQRGIQLATTAIGVAALQVREHRVPLERQGPAERLDGARRLVFRERGVASGNQTLEFPFLTDGVPCHDHPDHEGRQADGNDNQPPHAGTMVADVEPAPPGGV